MVGSIGTVPSLPLYRTLVRSDLSKQLASISARPQVQKTVAEFKKRVAEIKTAEEFVNDPKLLSFAATSFGLEGELRYQARLKQSLLSDPTDPNSVVRRLFSVNLTELARAFDFVKSGVTKVQSAAFIQELTDKFVNSQYEKELNNANPAVRNAFYFTKNITSVGGALDILGDSTLRTVVLEALALPQQIAAYPLERQIEIVSQRFKLDRVGDKGYIDGIVNQYLARQDFKAAQSRGNPVFTLFQ